MMRNAIRPAMLLHFLVLGLCMERASAVNDLTLNVPLGSQFASIGETVTVTMDVSNLVQPINGVQVFVQFDPALLDLVAITPNAAAGDLGLGWTVAEEAVISGDITYIVGLLADSTGADGQVATFTFTALGAGATQVSFDATSPVPTKLTGVDNATILPGLTDSQAIIIGTGAVPPAIGAIDVFYAGRFADAADASQTCLAVGTTAVSQNVTDHMSGITGIRVRFTEVVGFALTPADAFSFEWTTGTGTTFTPITAPASAVSVTATDGGGVTTVDVVFDDDLIRRRWLKVIIDATRVSAGAVPLDGELQGNPILVPSGDGTAGGDAVFFVGNMPGDVDGNGTTEFFDAVLARSQLNPFLPVPIDNAFDIDKDGKVLFFDAVQARAELNPFFTLPLISP